MQQDFEWMRVALAMGLMTLAFLVLPMFFLWKDKREDARKQQSENVGQGDQQ